MHALNYDSYNLYELSHHKGQWQNNFVIFRRYAAQNSAISMIIWSLRGYCTSYQKIACFVLYLKISNSFMKKKRKKKKRNMHRSYRKLFKELKNSIEILVGQAAFKLLDQNSQNVRFGSITQEPLGLP